MSKAVATKPDDQTAVLKEFFGKFNPDLPVTPENLRMVTEQIEIIGQWCGTVERIGLVERGKRLLWLKANMDHGEWLPLLERLRVPVRSAQRWMAEAKYVEDHGQMRQIGAFGATGVSHFTEEEAGELDADDLADPTKPAPLPRKTLERQLLALEKKVESLLKRDTKHQEEILALEEQRRTADEASDPGSIDLKRKPTQTALLRLLLAATSAAGHLQKVEDDALAVEFAADPVQFAGLIGRIQAVIEFDIVEKHGHRCGANVQAMIQED
jgi:hypothetical protein